MEQRMSDRLLEIGENLLVAFPVEKAKVSKGESTWEVVTSRIYTFKVGAWYPFLYDWNKLGGLSKGNYSGLNYLGETGHGSGSDILRIERDDFHVYHFFLTPDDPHCRIYKTISPIGDVLSALDRKLATDLAKVSAGSPFDSYTLKDCKDKFDPTTVAENLAARWGSDDDGKYMQWGFYAIETLPSTYTFYLRGRGYKLIPVVDRAKQKEMLEQALLPPEKQRVKTITITIGGIWKTDFTLGKFVPDSWENIENYIIYEP